MLIVGLILTPPVQNFIRKKAVSYLENKLHTRVEIGKIAIGLPKKVVVEGIYVEDQQKDTLLYGGSIKVDVALLKIIFNGEITINQLEIKDITAKIKRQLPDTAFNFQFIVDAFSPKEPSVKDPADTSSSSTKIDVKKVVLDNIRVQYKDVVTGNDAEVWLTHFDTRIDKFDLDHQSFDVPRTNLNGLVAKIYQSKPLSTPEPIETDIREAEEPIALQLAFREIDLKKIHVDYKNDVSATYSLLDLGTLNIRPNKIDLANRIIDVNNITLENTIAAIRLGKKEEAKVVEKEVEQELETQANAGWRIKAGSIDLNNNNLRFDNDNSPRQAKGMDFAHLKTDSLTLQVKNFLFSNDSIAGRIGKGTFKEQSGFVLQALETNFLYAHNQSYLNDLYLKTAGTELKRDITLRYDSIAVLKNDIGNLQLDLNIDNSHILVGDILTFVPDLQQQPAFADPNTTWYLDTRIKGRVADMQVDALQITGLKDTRIDISGNLAGLPDMKQLNANLVIRNISSSRRDMNLFIPRNTLPQNITLPGTLAIKGRVSGNTTNLNTDISLNTDLGNASVKGSLRQLNDPANMGYDATVQTSSLDLGTILQNKENFGPVTLTMTAKGKGTDPRTADAAFEGRVQSAVLKGYTYRDLTIKGGIANQQATLDMGMVDPNIHFALNASADLAKEYPAVKLNAMIDSIKAEQLHLSSGALVYRGKIEADFPITDPDQLEGTLLVTQSLLVRDQQRLQLDTLSVEAGKTDTGRYVAIQSNLMNARLEGEYKLTQLGNVFQQTIQPYFAVGSGDSTSSDAREPYDFTFNAFVVDNPAIKVFIPALEGMDSITIRSRFSDSSGWNAEIKAPSIDMGTNQVRDLQVVAGTSDSALTVVATVAQIKSGTNIELDNTTVTASLANNNIDFSLNIKDKELKNKYIVKGLVEQPRSGDYAISLKPDSLLLNYEAWTIADSNKFVIAKDGLNAKDFTLSKNGQQLSINSTVATANAPMEVSFENFQVATLTGFVQTDSTLVRGMLNGKATFNNLTNEPVFVGDLTINDLSLKSDTVGNVHILVDNKVKDTYAADVSITGRGNDVRLAGNYYLKTGASNFDFDLDIKEMPMSTAQAFSGGAIRESTGSVNGKFDVTGTIDQPKVKGVLNFNKTGFNLSMLNSYFTIDNEKVSVDDQGIRFDQFEIKDSAQNSLRLNGIAATTNFRNYNLDLTLKANNFRALNSTKKDNKLFYGQLYFNTDLRIKGTEAAPAIDGRLVVRDKTKMTVVLPQREPGVVEREGIVEFVDMDAPLSDSLFLAAYDSMNTSALTGMDISVNVEIDKEADFSLVIDEGNGDFLNVRGEALLNAGIDPTGQVSLTGSYELEEGSYDLTLDLFRRKFNIQKGSKIVWEGEPTKANVDITAVYIANTAPLDLVKNQLEPDISSSTRNTYLQKLPFEVYLMMEGKLLQPDISFDVKLPEDKSYVVGGDIITTVRTRLDQLRQEPGEMNKQVFSLLLLNRFVAENPFASSGGATNASTIARQSASKLLTEQLNKLADDLVTGVDLNFDVASSEDYTTGARRDRTDLNVGLSKQLLNDRLTVSIGSNFELEGPQSSSQSSNIAGNVALDYRLSKDNRYLLRAYRRNEYQGIIEGYVIETGVGFIITLDYNRFRDIFLSKKAREQQRLRRQQNRKSEEQLQQQQQSTTPTDKKEMPNN
jgi:hypothetical protein